MRLSYGYEKWFLTLREEHKQGFGKNTRKRFVSISTRAKETQQFRILHIVIRADQLVFSEPRYLGLYSDNRGSIPGKRREGTLFFVFATASRPALRSIHLSIQRVPGFFAWSKAAGA
jgi:hypothetical protein